MLLILFISQILNRRIKIYSLTSVELFYCGIILISNMSIEQKLNIMMDSIFRRIHFYEYFYCMVHERIYGISLIFYSNNISSPVHYRFIDISVVALAHIYFLLKKLLSAALFLKLYPTIFNGIR